jgi:hypothetical protein
MASKVKYVCATDVSPAMWAYACRKAGQRHIHNVRFEKGDFFPVFGQITLWMALSRSWHCTTFRIFGRHGRLRASRKGSAQGDASIFVMLYFPQ